MAHQKLQVINYGRLEAREHTEIQKLVDIAHNAGIFFLDLSSAEIGESLANMPAIVDAQRRFFAEGLEAKTVYADDSPNRGYDNFDELCVQRLKLSRKYQIEGKLSLPSHLQAVRTEINNMFDFNDTVLRYLSNLICSSSSPPITCAAVEDPQNPGASNMCLGLANASAGMSILGSHLDEDYLTITYYDEPFLEVLDHTTDEWRLVDVFERMPIVNVGDSFQSISENRLHAPYHRVVQSPNEINLIMYDLNGAEVY